MKDYLNKVYWNYVNEFIVLLKINFKNFWFFVKVCIGNCSVVSCIEYEGKRVYLLFDKVNFFSSFF